MIIKAPHLLTKLPIWWPKYSTQYSGVGEKVALLHKDKVDHGTVCILVEFTRAKHLKGQRFCIMREEAQRCPITTNGAAPMYEVPMSKLENWDSVEEIHNIINSFGW